MIVIIYITGILTGMFFLGMISYKVKYNTLKNENISLKSKNEELSKFKKQYGFRKRDGIIKKTFNRKVANKKVDFLIEITEIGKTKDKSKIIIKNINCIDPDENFTGPDYNRIKKLIGNWIKTSDIEWKIDKTKEEERNDAIDDILKEVQ